MSWETAERHIYTEEDIKENAYNGKGCYYIFDFDENLTYIGSSDSKTTTCRSRLLDHHRGDEGNCTSDSKNLYYASEYQADPRGSERTQLLRYELEHGALPKCNDVVPPAQ